MAHERYRVSTWVKARGQARLVECARGMEFWTGRCTRESRFARLRQSWTVRAIDARDVGHGSEEPFGRLDEPTQTGAALLSPLPTSGGGSARERWQDPPTEGRKEGLPPPVACASTWVVPKSR